MSPRTHSALASLSFLIAFAPSVARADGSRTAAAEALFEEARKLVAAGNHQEACPKFEESQRLDPAMGTQFNLADCWEKTGRTASAWAAFLDVSYSARQQNQPDRERAAKARAEALAPKLARLVVKVSAAAEQTGVRVERDGISLGRAQWATAVPVDPGAHTIVASAPDHKTWTATIQVAETSLATIEIPALEPSPVRTPEPAKKKAESAHGSHDAPPAGNRTLALLLGGVGVAGLAVGSAYGLMARSNNDDSMAYCAEKNLCLQKGVDLRDHARGDATVSTVAFAIGGAALAGGLVLWLTSPREAKGQGSTQRSVRATASTLGTGAQLGLEGSW